MKRATLFQIAREGWFVLIPLVVLMLVVHALLDWWAALPLVVLLVLGVLFFRDRPRHGCAEPLAALAPVDGQVMHRREGYDPFLDREAIRVSVRVDCLGAYYLRSPVEGTALELSGDEVEAFAGTLSWLRTDEGDDIVLAISAGWMLGARPCLGNYGARIGQGRCCGVRRLARVVDVYLPRHSRVKVEPGEHVRAGASVLAKFVHKTQVCGQVVK